MGKLGFPRVYSLYHIGANLFRKLKKGGEGEKKVFFVKIVLKYVCINLNLFKEKNTMKKLLILLAACALGIAYTAPVIAADWEFYGSARMSTFWEDKSKETTAQGQFDDEDLTWDLQSNSRIGATVSSGAIAGQFEYGRDPNLRLLYGTWNFGAGTLLVGQDYTPIAYFISNQVWNTDADLLGFGSSYDGRNPQLKVMMKGFSLALVKPNVTSATGLVSTETDTTIPKIVASYDFNLGAFALHLIGGYNSHDDVVVVGTTEREYSIDSYIYGVGFKFSPGPFYVNGNIYSGKNPNNFGLTDQCQCTQAVGAVYSPATDSIEDADTLGYALVVGFKASDMVAFEAGYGIVKDEIDAGAVTYESDVTAYYVNATINLAKGFFIVPEVGKIDYGDTEVTGQSDNPQGEITYVGAKWQVNF